MQMTTEQRQRMKWLCQCIQEETDHARFLELVRQLNDFLDEAERGVVPKNGREST
jgi:hypothetical protein